MYTITGFAAWERERERERERVKGNNLMGLFFNQLIKQILHSTAKMKNLTHKYSNIIIFNTTSKEYSCSLYSF